jgi:hypothetical protein
MVKLVFVPQHDDITYDSFSTVARGTCSAGGEDAQYLLVTSRRSAVCPSGEHQFDGMAELWFDSEEAAQTRSTRRRRWPPASMAGISSRRNAAASSASSGNAV